MMLKKQVLILAAGWLVAAKAFVPIQYNRLHERVYSHRLQVVNREDSSFDSFDMDDLRQRIEQETNPYSDLFRSHKVKKRPEHVHVILFNPGTSKQGMHAVEFPKGSGSNFILAFQSEKSCKSFCNLLKAQGFYDPSPRKYTVVKLEEICKDLGLSAQVVPDELKLIPPTGNVERLGHNPRLKGQKNRLNYLFDMSDAELEEDGVLVAEELCWE